MLYEQIFRELNAKKVKYLVIGGIAVNLYGFSRATGGLDIMISFENGNLSNFIKAVNHLKLRPKIPVKMEDFLDPKKRTSWINDKNMKVFSLHNLNNPMEQLDVMLENDVDFDHAYIKRETVKAGNIIIPIISINDLIKQKQKAGRERDALDVKTLKQIKKLRK